VPSSSQIVPSNPDDESFHKFLSSLTPAHFRCHTANMPRCLSALRRSCTFVARIPLVIDGRHIDGEISNLLLSCPNVQYDRIPLCSVNSRCTPAVLFLPANASSVARAMEFQGRFLDQFHLRGRKNCTGNAGDPWNAGDMELCQFETAVCHHRFLFRHSR